jgi:hypothetical protein
MCGNVQRYGRGGTLPPPPRTQWSVHSPALHHGGDAAKSVCSFSRGGFLTAHHGLFIYFLQVLFSLLNNPLFVPCIIQALKNTVSQLTLYLLPSYFIFLQKEAWAGLGLCACNMQRYDRGDATARRSPNHPPPLTQRKVHCPVLSHGRDFPRFGLSQTWNLETLK